jgi:O-antigen/teichoic acid export membrane protein
MAGKAATALSAFGAGVLTTRRLAPADLGTYLSLLNVVLAGSLVGSLGLGPMVVRVVAWMLAAGDREHARSAVVRILRIATVGGALAGTATGLGLFCASSTPPAIAIAMLTAACVMIGAVQRVTGEVFRGYSDMRGAALFGGYSVNGAYGASGSLLTVIALAATLRGSASVSGALAATLVAGAANLTAALGLLREPGRPVAAAVPAPAMRELLRESLPLMGSALVGFGLLQGDLLILAAFRPRTEVALYGAAARLALVVALPLFVSSSVLPPLVAGLYARGDRAALEATLRRATLWTGLPATVALAAFVLAGRTILGLVFGPFYEASYGLLVVLAIGQAVNVWSGCGSVFLSMTGHAREQLRLTIACGAALVLAGACATRIWGAPGLAVVVAATTAAQNVAMAWIAWRRTGVRIDAGRARSAAASGVATEAPRC